MTDCFFCKKKIGFTDQYVDLETMKKDSSYSNDTIPEGFTENDRICGNCLDSGKLEKNDNEVLEYLQLIEDLQLYEIGDAGRIEECYEILKHGGKLTESDLNYLTRLDISLQKIKKKQVKGTKPTIIIAIAVVCSVGAVLAVLVGWGAYENMLYEQSLEFGFDVEQIYSKYNNKINNCIPDRSSCFRQIAADFKSDYNSLARSYGYDPSDPSISNYQQLVVEYLQIEYNYLNEVYDIYNTDYDDYYYSYGHAPQLDSLADQWQNAYRMAVITQQLEP